MFPHPPAAWSSGWPTRRPVLSAGRGAFNAMWSNSLSILVTPPCSTLHSQWNLMKWRWAEWAWDPQHRTGNTHIRVYYLHSGDQLHSNAWRIFAFLRVMDVSVYVIMFSHTSSTRNRHCKISSLALRCSANMWILYLGMMNISLLKPWHHSNHVVCIVSLQEKLSLQENLLKHKG